MDLKVIESGGNGGDVVKTAKDLVVIEGFENMPYLAMFGGNLESSTPRGRLEGQQLFDFWGNNLVFPNNQSIQFNSETERALNNTALTSSGRVIIEQAVKADLKFMTDFVKVAVAVSIPTNDKVVIGVKLVQPDNLQSRQFVYIWDATRNELDLPYVPSTGAAPAPGGEGFDYTLDFSFI
jgi:hypothetical protein